MLCTIFSETPCTIIQKLLKYLTSTPRSQIISKPFFPGGTILLTKVVPESCQRTEGICAWLDLKAEKERIQLEKEQRKREKEEHLIVMAKERNIRNEKRQRENKMKKSGNCFAKNMENNNDMSVNKSFSREQSKPEKNPKSTVIICSACKSNKNACFCNKKKMEPIGKAAAVRTNNVLCL